MIDYSDLQKSLDENGAAVYSPNGNAEFALNEISKHFPDLDVSIDTDGDICIQE